jgi:hypothetical protein
MDISWSVANLLLIKVFEGLGGEGTMRLSTRGPVRGLTEYFRLPFLWSIGALVFCEPALAQKAVEWRQIQHGFEVAEKQKWEGGEKSASFRFSAMRIHLGYFELKLASIPQLSQQFRDKFARAQRVRPSLFDLGLNNIFRVDPFDRSIQAIASAGFPVSERQAISSGFLKIDGRQLMPFDEQGPSAVFCLHSPNPRYATLPYQVPVFYRSGDSRFKDCRDAIQVGPRILEDPNTIVADKPSSEQIVVYDREKPNGEREKVELYLAITKTDEARFFRTIFAVDEPGRDEKEQRNNARNAYVIVTHDSVALWDVQTMLLNSAFYANPHFAPRWALNLVGGDYAGLMVRDSRKGLGFGNVDVTQASVVVVFKRN